MAETSDKIIFRAITIIRTSLRFSEWDNLLRTLHNYLVMWTGLSLTILIYCLIIQQHACKTIASLVCHFQMYKLFADKVILIPVTGQYAKQLLPNQVIPLGCLTFLFLTVYLKVYLKRYVMTEQTLYKIANSWPLDNFKKLDKMWIIKLFNSNQNKKKKSNQINWVMGM